MAPRVWDAYLTEQDRQHAARMPVRPWGFGARPALLLVDLYRSVFGERPQPLLEAMDDWPMTCGTAGWEALPHIQRLLATARDLEVPVIHVAGTVDVPGWYPRTAETPEQVERRRRGYEIIDEVAPVEGETVLRKAGPSAFWGTPLIGYLTELGVDTLIVAGETTSGCIRATVVDARTNRFRVTVPEECVFDRTQAAHAINLFDMHAKYADVVGVDEVISRLTEHVAATTGRRQTA